MLAAPDYQQPDSSVGPLTNPTCVGQPSPALLLLLLAPIPVPLQILLHDVRVEGLGVGQAGARRRERSRPCAGGLNGLRGGQLLPLWHRLRRVAGLSGCRVCEVPPIGQLRGTILASLQGKRPSPLRSGGRPGSGRFLPSAQLRGLWDVLGQPAGQGHAQPALMRSKAVTPELQNDACLISHRWSSNSGLMNCSLTLRGATKSRMQVLLRPTSTGGCAPAGTQPGVQPDPASLPSRC